jgi:Bacterial antitoxin of type II TA system, VapB
MRTTLTIDDVQAEDLMQATGQNSAVAAIRQALDDYLRQARKKKVLALRGQVQIEDNWRDLRALEVEVVTTGGTRKGNAA